MTTFDLSNPNPNPGDRLRDEAANLLAPRYGQLVREARVAGKKADLYFEHEDHGKTVRFYLEAKDYERNVSRDEVTRIWADYSGIIENNRPATLLLVTRQGLSPDAQSFVLRERPEMRHQTIWELENETLGLTDYIRWESDLFNENGLSTYYVEGRARRVRYAENGDERTLDDGAVEVVAELDRWMADPDNNPVAILGGYGAGKSSLARRLVSTQAKRALEDPSARRPVLIPLGNLARYSTIEGLLGGMFTHDHPIRQGFHVRTFLELNEKGRLVIVLDGFDEMKHAMSWADFRAQIADLNRLTKGNSKVLLLGRPSAFTSTDEHFHVLRGRKRWEDGWRRLPDWPEFVEYDLEEFTAEERATFFRGYLRYLATRAGRSLGEEWIEQRVAEVEMIADMEPDLFGKPVHAKILIDLASDPDVDLSRFASGVTRWGLYEIFFSSLAEREMDKEVRRPIGEGPRIAFLREVAYWLWTERGGSTSFSAADLPDDLFGALAQGEAADAETLKREYLTGSFLEKKSGDIYYFGHRSFAEFLVADRMVSHSPGVRDQPVYSRLVRDGVLEFLRDAPDRAIFKRWTDTISNAAGTIHLEYLSFLAEMLGGNAALRTAMPATSIWLPILELFDEGPIELRDGLDQRILQAMKCEENVLFFLLLSLFRIQAAFRNVSPSVAAEILGGVILERLFSRATYDEVSRKAMVDRSGDEARELAHAVIAEVTDRNFDRAARFRGRRLIEASDDELRRAGTDIAIHEPFRMVDLADDFWVPWLELLGKLSTETRAMVRTYFATSPTLANVFTRQVKPPSRKPRKL